MGTLLDTTFPSPREVPVRRRIKDVFAALLTVGALSAGVKAIGALKLAVTAWLFGTSAELDAYLIAFLIPSFFADVVSAAMSSAMVPALLQLRARKGSEAATSLYQNVLTVSIVLLAIFAVVLGVGAAAFPGISERVRLTLPMLLILLPAMPVAAVAIGYRAVLHADERFAVAAAAPAVTPLVSILFLLTMTPAWGAHVLAVGTLAGTVLETVLLAIAVKRRGHPIRPRWTGFDPEVGRVLSQCLPVLAGTLILGGSTLVDQAFAISFGEGGISTLNYGTRLTTVLLAVGVAAAGTVFLPFLSNIAATGDTTALWHAFRRSLRFLVIASIPLAGLLIAFSAPIVRMFLQHGAISAETASQIARVQQFSLIQIPIAVALTLVIRLTAALQANHLLFAVAPFSLAINAAADAVLMRQMGIAGIAAADSVAAAFTLVALSALLIRRAPSV